MAWKKGADSWAPLTKISHSNQKPFSPRESLAYRGLIKGIQHGSTPCTSANLA